jgi:hypothetical protein
MRLGEAGRFMAALTKGWRSEDRRYEDSFAGGLWLGVFFS